MRSGMGPPLDKSPGGTDSRFVDSSRRREGEGGKDEEGDFRGFLGGGSNGSKSIKNISGINWFF